MYRSAKQHNEPVSKPHNKWGAKVDEITLTQLELIERIAALVPPPRTHRHRYFGVLAPNSPHRAEVVTLAQGAVVQPAQVQAEPASSGVGAPGAGNAPPTQAVLGQSVQPKRPAHYLWEVLIVRIYEVLALLCPLCGGQQPNHHHQWQLGQCRQLGTVCRCGLCVCAQRQHLEPTGLFESPQR